MSRSGYTDDGENVELYRQAVNRAIRGARGQHFLEKLRAALDAMPTKELITDEIVTEHGDVCALGALDPNPTLDPEDIDTVAQHFGIARSLAAEIVYMNDEWPTRFETPEARWLRMRAWIEQQILPEAAPSPEPPA